jgi:hypothetical protein
MSIPQDPPAPPARPSPVLVIVVTAIGVVPYAMMMVGIGSLHDVDGISRGLGGVYAITAIVLLWILLAVNLINAAMAGSMPTWSAISAFLLHPLSLVAAIVALDLFAADLEHGWAIATPAVVPPLFALYALWCRLPALHRVLPPNPTSGVVWGVVFLLAAAPVAGMIEREAARAARQGQVPVISDQQRREEERAQRLARFEQLTPNSPLEEYLPYLRVGDELRDRALAAVRRLDTRQAQAEKLLRQDFGLLVIRNLPVLELQPTPGLCQAAKEYLVRRAANDRPKGANPTFWVIDDDLKDLMPGLRWMVAQHCDAGEALAAVEAAVLAYPEASYTNNQILAARRRVYLDDLEGLRRYLGH